MKSKLKWTIAGTLLVIVVGAVAATWLIGRRGYEEIQPRRGEITEAVYSLGRVEARHRYELKVGVITSADKFFVKEGQAVKKGDRLVAIDGGTVFRAPFDGTVTWIPVFEGENIFPQTLILRMEDLSDRYIELSLEQEGALRVRSGQTAKVSFESLRGDVLTGKVAAIFPQGDEFLVHIAVDGLGPNVLPGMTADVSVEIGRIPDALLIPLKAISNGTVTILRNGRRKKVKVDVGHVDGMWAEIKDDSITLEDRVLVRKGN